MIIFLYGEESFLSSEKLKEIKNKFLRSADHAGLSILDFSENKNENIISSFSSQGLFSSRRLVIVKNFIQEADKEKQKELLDFFKKKMGNILADNDLTIIFWEGKSPAKNNTFFKYLFQAKEIKKQDFSKLSEIRLSSWVKKKIEVIDPKVSISEEAIQKLMAYCNNNPAILNNEIARLINFSKSGKITPEDVENLVKASIAGNIFTTIDALGCNNKREALKLVLEHFERGDDPFYLLSMFVYQFRNILIVADLKDQGMNNEYEIAKVAKLHPYVVKKSLNSLRNLPLEKLKKIYAKLSEIDSASKTGKADIKLELQKFIVEL